MSGVDQHPGDPDLARAKLLAAVDAAQRMLDEARALLGATDVAISPVILPAPNPPTEPLADVDQWLMLGEAASRLHYTEQTMSRLVREHGLGRKIRGRWRIDPRRLKLWQSGREYEPLAP